MMTQLGRTTELVNTHFAPVAALIVYYEAQNVLEPLQSVTEKDENKLEQVVLSMLTGVDTWPKSIRNFARSENWHKSNESIVSPTNPPCPEGWMT